MLKILIVSLLALSVQAVWWWPWSRKKDSPQVPFVYYNETTGVEAVITKDFIQELDPFVFGLLKLIITGIKIPISPQKLGPGGLITINFEDATCHQLRIIRDQEAPGLYLGDGFIGLGVKFDVKCRTWFQTTKVGYMHGWANITLTGVNGNAHVALNYDNHVQNIEPEIIDPFELNFKEIDIKLDNNVAFNGITTVLKAIFPKVASVLFKKSITLAVHSLASKLDTLNFGFKKHYHPIFLYPPVINPEKVKLNLALVEWNMQSKATSDARDNITNDDQYSEQEDGDDDNDDQYSEQEDGDDDNDSQDSYQFSGY